VIRDLWIRTSENKELRSVEQPFEQEENKAQQQGFETPNMIQMF
jgi:hypothetical protein